MRSAADILDELERVLRERAEHVLRLEALEEAPGEAKARERATIGHHLACHATDIDRCLAELGAIEPPEDPPLA